MLNPLIMYGGKKGSDLGIGMEFDADSLHHVDTHGGVTVVEAELARAMIQRPPHALWSPAFEWRYSLSVWICPHKFVGGQEHVPWLACLQRPTDASNWLFPETRNQSSWGIYQMTPLAAGGGHGVTEGMYIGHSDGSNRYGRTFSIKRNWWTHIFITVDTSQAVAEDRQKVWINGVFTHGGKGAAYWGDLQPNSAHAQWPANPFLSRDYPGGHAQWVPPTDPKAANVTMGIHSGGPFWNHPTNLPIGLGHSHAGIAALYFIDDAATVDQIGEFDPITNVWHQKPQVPKFGNASFYMNFKDRAGDQVGANGIIVKDQLGTTNGMAFNSYQNVSGSRNTFRGKVEQVTYPNIP